jgi:hypothetical protein
MLAVDFSPQITQSGDLQKIIKLPLEFLLLNMDVCSAVVAGILV